MLCVLGGGAMPSGMSTLSRLETTSGACACSTAAAAPHCGQAACIRHQHHIIPPPPPPAHSTGGASRRGRIVPEAVEEAARKRVWVVNVLHHFARDRGIAAVPTPPAAWIQQRRFRHTPLHTSRHVSAPIPP